jgi:hypothetical protein
MSERTTLTAPPAARARLASISKLDTMSDFPSTPVPSRVAVASALIVSARGSAGSKASIPSRSRSSRTRMVVQALPLTGLHRIRFNVTAG